MKADRSRDTYDPRKHYRRVLFQQGRVVLDAILRGHDKMLQGESVEAVLPEMNDDVNAVLNRERARAAAMAK